MSAATKTLETSMRSRLLEEHPEVLAITDPFQRRVRVREVLAGLLVQEGVGASELGGVLRAVSDGLSGLGVIERLLREEDVTEVMVNAPDEIYVERSGRIERSSLTLSSDEETRMLIERIIAPLGARIDSARPWVDAKMPDGSRLHAILPPLAAATTVTIRRAPRRKWSLRELLDSGSLLPAEYELLVEAVAERKNLLVCGGAGSGKTTLLRALCGEVADDQRLITIEDTAELGLSEGHVVALESRPENCEGRGEVSIGVLLRQALRMRPDRIVVGEVRGVEVLDMLQAMNTGHDGSMATLHANSTADALVRIEAMATSSGIGLSSEALARQVSSAIDLIVSMSRGPKGVRRVSGIERLRAEA